ncbi:MAG: hypothetical protein AB7V32_09145 [Candidatus Berkiella sp.]
MLGMQTPSAKDSNRVLDLSKMPGPETFPLRYTRVQTANLLRLVELHLDPSVPYILKVGHSEPAKQYFKWRLSYELNKDETEQSFDTLVQKVQTVLSEIEREPQLNLSTSIHHLWARLYRDAFLYGDVLNLYDIRVIAAWRVFHLRLKAMLDAAKVEEPSSTGNMYVATYQEIALYEVKTCFLEFMGQLIRLGEIQSARLIHQYFCIARKISAQEEREGSMSLDQVAAVTNIPLLHGLGLKNVLSPETSRVLVDSKESRFMAHVIKRLLPITPFTKTFAENVEYYGTFYQNDAQFRGQYIALVGSCVESLGETGSKGTIPCKPGASFEDELVAAVGNLSLKTKKPISTPPEAYKMVQQSPFAPAVEMPTFQYQTPVLAEHPSAFRKLQRSERFIVPSPFVQPTSNSYLPFHDSTTTLATAAAAAAASLSSEQAVLRDTNVEHEDRKVKQPRSRSEMRQ